MAHPAAAAAAHLPLAASGAAPIDHIAARVALLHSNTDVADYPPETLAAMKIVCDSCFALGDDIMHAMRGPGVKYNDGRVIAAIDLVIQAKHVALDALRLPHVGKPAK
jgi:hypothetical protein